MANTKEQQWQAFARRAARVSKALWPTGIRRSLATGTVAQMRRKLLLMIVRTRASSMKHHMNNVERGVERKSFPGVLGKALFPNTPMPVEPPLVRVLETFDLSETNVEHFLDLPEGGNTGGYSLENWKEAQTSFPRTVRE